MRALVLPSLLLLAFAPTALAVGPEDVIIVPPAPRCVFLAQDLDYAHYLCVDPRDVKCAVYVWSTSGSHEVKRCYVVLDWVTVEPSAAASCIPTSGGMDYHSYLCVDPRNPRCAVYTLTTSDWGTRKTCIPGA